MDVGLMLVMTSYGWDEGSDAQMWGRGTAPLNVEMAAEYGFDSVWSAEHHFNDYSFVPDNLQLMTHIAAKHPNIDVGTAAVILPWHNPLRVAENAAVLDMLSGGRLRLGVRARTGPGASLKPSVSAWTNPATASTRRPP